MKGERPAEIVGLARTMRGGRRRLSRTYAPVFDTCGTGGDRAHTFNVSTVAALVLAACGVRVAKHGNRSVSSRCGSADLFEALGRERRRRRRRSSSGAWTRRGSRSSSRRRFIRRCGTPRRRGKDLGVRTAFNLLGPLTNPAGASRQLVGVPRPELTELVARSLALLGSRARVGRARRGRPRRDLDDRLHEGVGVPRRGGQHVLRASRPTSGCRRRRPPTCAAAMPPTTRAIARASPRRRAGRRARHRPAQRRRRRCSSPAQVGNGSRRHRRGG